MSILPPDPVYCLKSDMEYVYSICFPIRPGNYASQLLAATKKGIYFWDLETNRLQHKLATTTSFQAVHSYDFDIITQEKETIALWTIENNSGYKIKQSYECDSAFCKSLLVDNQIVAANGHDIHILDIKNFEKIRECKPNNDSQGLGTLMCLEVFQIKEMMCVLAGYESGDLLLFDYNSAKVLSEAKLKQYLTSVTFDPDQLRGICGNASNMLEIFTINGTTFEISVKCIINLPNDGCGIVRLRPDRKLFVCGGWDGRLRYFSWRTLKQLAAVAEHKNAVTDAQFSPQIVRLWDAKIVAASSADGAISLWNLYKSYN